MRDVRTPEPPGDGADGQTTETLGPPGKPWAGVPAAAVDLVPGARVGRYVLLARVGAGGMGVVWAGYDPELDRKVALKLLRPDRAGGEVRRLRLLREAQATARLVHPNVVTVHDVGTFGEQVFVAMEFVEGRTLGAWLAERRPWREVLAVFLQAGRGLAAAHAAGLVHRDFKPDNVLLGDDGRVRVADFGLVRPFGEADDGEGAASSSPASPSSPGTPLSLPLTEEGRVFGTPLYMAPEQFRGEAAGPAADQFSFCLALYQGLYGEHPFAAATPAERVREAPQGARVPGWVRQAVVRGLAARPEERHDSVGALLAALSRDPAAARRRWLAAAGVVCAAGLAAGGGLWLAGRKDRLCSGAEARLAGVWDGGRKEAVRAAFLATGVPFAAGAWERAERGLDRYLGGWAGMHRAACEATRVTGEQSEALLDRRMFCLDQRLREAGAAVDLFARADAQVVETSARAVAALTPLAACADSRSLAERVPPPAGEPARQRVAALVRRLAAAKALREAGKYPQGLAAARALPAAARRLGYRPAEAEALLLVGDLEEKAGRPEAARGTLEEALWTAEAAADDAVKAEAAIALMDVDGRVRQRFAEAHRARRLAAAIVQRLGDRRLEARLLDRQAQVYEAEGRYAEALGSGRRGIELHRADATQPLELAAALRDSARYLIRLGRHQEARAPLAEALALETRLLGPEHPEVAETLVRLGNLHYAQGDFAAAVPPLDRAVRLRERALGPEHPLLAEALNDLGNTFDALSRYDKALAAHRRALAIREKAFGAHASIASSLDNIGAILANRREFAEAFEYHKRALAMRERTVGRKHPSAAISLHNLGNALVLQDRHREALPYFVEALEVERSALGPDHPYVAEELTVIADIRRRLGEPGRAVAPLERALAIVEAQPLDASRVGRTRFALAQALWESGGDRARAVRLARQARADLAGRGEQDQVALDEVDAWLRRRPGD